MAGNKPAVLAFTGKTHPGTGVSETVLQKQVNKNSSRSLPLFHFSFRFQSTCHSMPESSDFILET